MQEKKRTTLIILAICAVFVGMFGYFNSPGWLARPAALTDKLPGTYVAGSGPEQIWLAMDHDEQTFYYTDQANGQYLVGTVEKVGEGRYQIACPNEESAQILPEQEITLVDKRLTVTISGEERIFTKNNEAATTSGNALYR